METFNIRTQVRQDQRIQVLTAFYHLYDKTGNRYSKIRDAFDFCNLSEQDFFVALDYLSQQSWVKRLTFGGLDGKAELTNFGIVEFERTVDVFQSVPSMPVPMQVFLGNVGAVQNGNWNSAGVEQSQAVNNTNFGSQSVRWKKIITSKEIRPGVFLVDGIGEIFASAKDETATQLGGNPECVLDERTAASSYIPQYVISRFIPRTEAKAWFST